MSTKRTGGPARAETVARAALALVDSGGLESLTMRRLATGLGVQLPTIYRLFDGKHALLDAMAETILSDVLARITDDDEDADWTDRLTTFAHGLRQTLLAQRDGARIVGGNYAAQQHTHALAETLLGGLHDAGFPVETAVWAGTTVFCYVLGEVLEQQGATGDEAEVLANSLSGNEFPRLAKMPVELFVAFDARFEFGLRVVVSGLRTALAELT
ncbi:TetR/AcrR family transcriptional regulator C-terminal domain-containing protein [Amycolatopsis sp. CA-230715]|uniref:TetR/AcrR family transcriptional regulator C-terminal domain-containing protein n=1 Tax=Amycolatopsis sp. CA-230715 TaxID=2745196 RepID=UPI001C01B124|nr:TetR/AcrR family transcriptional regulator C-terminal domain-containing protein [Amycolatopsis sp. CA-230715]